MGFFGGIVTGIRRLLRLERADDATRPTPRDLAGPGFAGRATKKKTDEEDE